MFGFKTIVCDLGFPASIYGFRISSVASGQPWELGKKYDGNFIFTFAVVKVRYGGITTAKIFKHGNYLK